jgi:hypothetical protein
MFPALTTTRVKKSKRKATKAELEAQSNFSRLQAKWDKQYGKLSSKKRRPAEMPNLAPPPGRETLEFNSRSTPGGDTAAKPQQRYSGTKIKGVALMHKSSYAPVYDDQDAIDMANMRR